MLWRDKQHDQVVPSRDSLPSHAVERQTTRSSLAIQRLATVSCCGETNNMIKSCHPEAPYWVVLWGDKQHDQVVPSRDSRPSRAVERQTTWSSRAIQRLASESCCGETNNMIKSYHPEDRYRVVLWRDKQHDQVALSRGSLPSRAVERQTTWSSRAIQRLASESCCGETNNMIKSCHPETPYRVMLWRDKQQDQVLPSRGSLPCHAVERQTTWSSRAIQRLPTESCCGETNNMIKSCHPETPDRVVLWRDKQHDQVAPSRGSLVSHAVERQTTWSSRTIQRIATESCCGETNNMIKSRYPEDRYRVVLWRDKQHDQVALSRGSLVSHALERQTTWSSRAIQRLPTETCCGETNNMIKSRYPEARYHVMLLRDKQHDQVVPSRGSLPSRAVERQTTWSSRAIQRLATELCCGETNNMIKSCHPEARYRVMLWREKQHDQVVPSRGSLPSRAVERQATWSSRAIQRLATESCCGERSNMIKSCHPEARYRVVLWRDKQHDQVVLSRGSLPSRAVERQATWSSRAIQRLATVSCCGETNNMIKSCHPEAPYWVVLWGDKQHDQVVPSRDSRPSRAVERQTTWSSRAIQRLASESCCGETNNMIKSYHPEDRYRVVLWRDKQHDQVALSRGSLPSRAVERQTTWSSRAIQRLASESCFGETNNMIKSCHPETPDRDMLWRDKQHDQVALSRGSLPCYAVERQTTWSSRAIQRIATESCCGETNNMIKSRYPEARYRVMLWRDKQHDQVVPSRGSLPSHAVEREATWSSRAIQRLATESCCGETSNMIKSCHPEARYRVMLWREKQHDQVVPSRGSLPSRAVERQATWSSRAIQRFPTESCCGETNNMIKSCHPEARYRVVLWIDKQHDQVVSSRGSLPSRAVERQATWSSRAIQRLAT